MEKDKETKATEEREGSQVNQNVVDFGSAMTKTAHGTVYTLAIIGQIEGHTAAPNGTKTTQYEHMLPLLAKLEESREVDGILFLLNTVGGDVEAGLAIAELIAGLTKPTAAIVLGGSHSIGVPLAVAAQRSFAVPSAAMTIHPVRMSGTVIAAPQTYNYFQRLQERIVAFVAGHSRISAEKFQALMLAKDDMAADVGSVIYGEEAVHLGSSTSWADCGKDWTGSIGKWTKRGGDTPRFPIEISALFWYSILVKVCLKYMGVDRGET